MPSTADLLVSYVGILEQTAGTLLITAVLAALGRRAAERPYFAGWTWYWASLAVAVLAGVAHYGVARGALAPGSAAASAWAHATLAIYQMAKLQALTALALGCRAYGEPAATPCMAGNGNGARVHALAALAVATLTLADAPTINVALGRQAPFVAVLYAASCAFVLRRARRDRALGAGALAAVLATHAALWCAYGVGLAAPRAAGAAAPLVAALLHHNSYVDLLAGVLLAFGMVLAFTDDLWQTARAQAESLAAAHAALRAAAHRDPLTGALARRAFDDGVGLVAVAVVGWGTVASVDVDDLKPVNDRQGHAAGDALLCAAVRAVTGVLARDDSLYRWGGDEFVVVCPGRAADEVAAALRRALSDGSGVRASVGAAPFVGGESAAVTHALSAADAAMYADKRRRKSERGARPRGAAPAALYSAAAGR